MSGVGGGEVGVGGGEEGGGCRMRLTNDKAGKAYQGAGPLIGGTTDSSCSSWPVMYLPGCFLLTLLFQGHPFQHAAWCHSKVFQVKPPSTLARLPATFIHYSSIGALQLRASGCAKLEANSCLLHRACGVSLWSFVPSREI